jgi:hypothetical protein
VIVEIPAEEAAGFAETLASDEYEATERGYKDAVVRVVAWIFAAEDETELARRLAAFFGGTLEVDDLGLSGEELERTRVALEPMRGPQNAFANLCGGRWGVNNFVWIAGAIADGLGEEIASVFSRLVDPTDDLVARVERFSRGTPGDRGASSGTPELAAAVERRPHPARIHRRRARSPRPDGGG